MDGIEIRCPANPVRLLLRVGHIVQIEGANMIEVACRDCRNQHRKNGEKVDLVLHRFNVAGELVETEVS